MTSKILFLLFITFFPLVHSANSQEVNEPVGNVFITPIGGKDSEGNAKPINVDDDGNLNVSNSRTSPAVANSFSVDKSAALEASSLTKASAGKICSLSGRVDSTAPTATYYLQLIDASAVPADGAITLLISPLKIQHTNTSDSIFNIDLNGSGSGKTCVYGSDGLAWDLSSTEFTKTVSGAYVSATALYE